MKRFVPMLSVLGMLLVAACGMPTSEEVINSSEQKQVSHCTNGGCSDFEIECGNTGGEVVCFYAKNDVEPSRQQAKQCEHWEYMVEWLCGRDLPSDKPCLNAEKKMFEKCFYVPTSVCVDGDSIFDLLQTHPDVCRGTCTDVFHYFEDPDNYPQPLCSSDFQ